MPEPLEPILALLHDADWQVRYEAVEQLGKLGEDAPLEPLLTALDDPHVSVRRETLTSLGQLGTRTPIDVLIAAIHHPELAQAALQALGPRTPIDVLIMCLGQPHLVYTVRRLIQTYQLFERLPVQPLLALYDRDWEHHRDILQLLSMMSHRLPPSFLIQLLSEAYDPSHEREMLTQVLQPMQDTHLLETVLNTASTRYWSTQTIAIRVLGMLKQEAPVEVLLHSMSEGCQRVSEAACKALEAVADQVPYERLLALLHHQRSWVRIHALKIWEMRTDLPPLEALIALLKDENEQVRTAAAYVCQERETGMPLSYLIEAAQEDHFSSVSAVAVSALAAWGKHAPTATFAGLVDLMRYANLHPTMYSAYAETLPIAMTTLAPLVSEETLLQAFADVGGAYQLAQLVGSLGTPAAIDLLLAALASPSERVRRSAVEGLGLTNSPQPVPALLALLHDLAETPFAWSRTCLIEALCLLWQHVPGAVLLSILRHQHLAAIAPDKVFQALAKKQEHIPGDLLMQTLHTYAQHSDFGQAALAYLGAFDQLPSIPEAEMYRALARVARHCSVAELQSIRHLLTLPPLLQLLGDSDIHILHGALTLLRCFPGHAPLEPVTKLLHDANSRVRGLATRCLIDIAKPFPAALFTHILSDPEADVRNEFLEYLAGNVTLDHTTPIDALIATLADPDAWNRLWALDALSKPELLERVPVEVFVQAVGTHYPYPDQQQFALRALQAKDPPRALEQCLLVLGNSDYHVCQTAFKIIQEVCPTIVPEIVQEALSILTGGQASRFFTAHSQRFFAEMVGYAGHAAPHLVARLGELLACPYWEVRMQAARALGRLRSDMPASIMQRLQELCHDPDAPAVREAARMALTQLLTPEK